MIEFTCIVCGSDFETDGFPFGDDIQCPNCSTWLSTDWDYINEDSMAAWVTGISENLHKEES